MTDEYLRIADLGSVLYIDLADELSRVIEVTASGWRVIPSSDTPVTFRRDGSVEPLPMPVAGVGDRMLSEILSLADEPIREIIDRLRPEVLGALCDRVSKGLARLASMQRSDHPEAADIARLAKVCTLTFGIDPGMLAGVVTTPRESLH